MEEAGWFTLEDMQKQLGNKQLLEAALFAVNFLLTEQSPLGGDLISSMTENLKEGDDTDERSAKVSVNGAQVDPMKAVSIDKNMKGKHEDGGNAADVEGYSCGNSTLLARLSTQKNEKQQEEKMELLNLSGKGERECSTDDETAIKEKENECRREDESVNMVKRRSSRPKKREKTSSIKEKELKKGKHVNGNLEADLKAENMKEKKNQGADVEREVMDNVGEKESECSSEDESVNWAKRRKGQPKDREKTIPIKEKELKKGKHVNGNLEAGLQENYMKEKKNQGDAAADVEREVMDDVGEKESKCSIEDESVNWVRRSKCPKKREKRSGKATSAAASNQTKTQSSHLKRDKDGNIILSNMCHQCQRNDKGRVVRCSKCTTKRYCVPCMTRWYPNMIEDDFAENCPVCRNNCNCKRCLRMDLLIGARDELLNLKPELSNADNELFSISILRSLLPFLEKLDQEQEMEMQVEAKIQGRPLSEFELQEETFQRYESIFCNYCKTSIFDFHRTCPTCFYVLCLTCCRELRGGHLQGGEEELMMSYAVRDHDYMHGLTLRYRGPTTSVISASNETVSDSVQLKSQWNANVNGVIPCPMKDRGGCGTDILQFGTLFPKGWVTKLVSKAKERASKCIFNYSSELPPPRCPCFTEDGEIDFGSNKNLKKVSSRKSSVDNYLYCPAATELKDVDMHHFQWHWRKGQPVIVRNVLETTRGLSWEPMVMWRACRQITSENHALQLDVNAVNCLSWSEMRITFHQFFREYLEGEVDSYGWPKILKLKDWPSLSSFQEDLPRHGVEFISCLPFKHYTHPHNGFLNLATKLPEYYLKPDLGPQAYIAHGVPQELGRGDSVTKLHCNISDTVNVLTHSAAVALSESTLRCIRNLKKKHKAHDEREILGSSESTDKVEDDRACPSNSSPKLTDSAPQLGEDSVGHENSNGGALWDIFRREDVSKLQEYIRKHHKEFRHEYCSPLQQVAHPIHDQTIYLSREHKQRLKEEYEIEAWTFVQNLGDAVFVPAGCPHQVRNLKSCIKVGLDFVSPENVSECLRLTEEFRLLPQNHTTQKDKLEVKKMILHAINDALTNLEEPEGHMQKKGLKKKVKK